MKKQTKTILGLLLFVVFLAIAYFAYNKLSANYKPKTEIQKLESRPTAENKKTPAPDFTVLDAQGNKVNLSDMKGKPVVLNFWASWCPPCKSEMPHFNEVYKKSKENVVFMMVDLVDGQRETVAKGQSYVTEQGYSFPVYFDTTQEAANVYQISSIPTTLLIDKDGYVVTGYQGAIDIEKLEKGIELITK